VQFLRALRDERRVICAEPVRVDKKGRMFSARRSCRC
jgi:hypothetical protein